MVGGKVHVEMPVSEILKKIEGETVMLKELMTPFQKQIYEIIFGKLLEIKTIKADIIIDGEQIYQGIYDITVDYTFVHEAGTEEKGTFVLQGKKWLILANFELPVCEIWKMLELGTSLKELMTPVQKNIYEKFFGKLFEIKTTG